jgi:hypothetical protein
MIGQIYKQLPTFTDAFSHLYDGAPSERYANPRSGLTQNGHT